MERMLWNQQPFTNGWRVRRRKRKYGRWYSRRSTFHVENESFERVHELVLSNQRITIQIITEELSIGRLRCLMLKNNLSVRELGINIGSQFVDVILRIFWTKCTIYTGIKINWFISYRIQLVLHLLKGIFH